MDGVGFGLCLLRLWVALGLFGLTSVGVEFGYRLDWISLGVALRWVSVGSGLQRLVGASLQVVNSNRSVGPGPPATWLFRVRDPIQL